MAVFYIIAIALIITLVILAVLPQVYYTEQVVIIRKALTEVRDTVSNLNLYPQWSPMQLAESGCDVQMEGLPHTAGHTCSWKGGRSGKGFITIRAIDDRHVHFDLEIISWKLKSKDNWFFEEWGNEETKVTLQNNGRCTFPFARIFSRLVTKNIHRRLGTALNNLKSLCESSSQ